MNKEGKQWPGNPDCGGGGEIRNFLPAGSYRRIFSTTVQDLA
jgi:hypothetical protein